GRLRQAQEHIEVIAAYVVVDVPPIGIADVGEAIGPTAIVRVGQADAAGVVGGREGEGAAGRQKRLDLRGGQGWPGSRRVRLFDEAAGGLGNSRNGKQSQ